MTERCEWCGDAHDVTALCQRAQRGLTRRSFLFLSSAAVIGLALPSLPVEAAPRFIMTSQANLHVANPNIGTLVAEVWNDVIGKTIHDVEFQNASFMKMFEAQMRQKLKVTR